MANLTHVCSNALRWIWICRPVLTNPSYSRPLPVCRHMSLHLYRLRQSLRDWGYLERPLAELFEELQVASRTSLHIYCISFARSLRLEGGAPSWRTAFATLSLVHPLKNKSPLTNGGCSNFLNTSSSPHSATRGASRSTGFENIAYGWSWKKAQDWM